MIQPIWPNFWRISPNFAVIMFAAFIHFHTFYRDNLGEIHWHSGCVLKSSSLQLQTSGALNSIIAWIQKLWTSITATCSGGPDLIRRIWSEADMGIFPLIRISYSKACKTDNQGDAERVWNRQATHPRHFTWQCKEYEKAVDDMEVPSVGCVSHTHLLCFNKMKKKTFKECRYFFSPCSCFIQENTS